MTEVSEIYQSLFNYFSAGYCYQMKNVFLFHYDWESDFFCMNREGYCFEMEVKVSRSDFKADFKKQKHRFFTGIEVRKMIPNRFYYVVPKGLIAQEDVPSYAGLIYVEKSHANIVKRAPFLHRAKIDFRKKLCDKFYYQWLELTKENRILKRDRMNLENQVNSLLKINQEDNDPLS